MHLLLFRRGVSHSPSKFLHHAALTTAAVALIDRRTDLATTNGVRRILWHITAAAPSVRRPLDTPISLLSSKRGASSASFVGSFTVKGFVRSVRSDRNLRNHIKRV